MQTLTQKMRNMEIAQIIDETLFRYYSDKVWKFHNGGLKKIHSGG